MDGIFNDPKQDSEKVIKYICELNDYKSFEEVIRSQIKALADPNKHFVYKLPVINEQTF